LAGGRLHLSVVALENACEECLVPREIMARAIADSLRDPTVTEIRLRYPGEA
jgi:hypothetical protein